MSAQEGVDLDVTVNIGRETCSLRSGVISSPPFQDVQFCCDLGKWEAGKGLSCYPDGGITP